MAMEQFLSASSALFLWLVDYTRDITILICLIFLLKLIAGKKLPAWWHYCIWLILLVRMIIPWDYKNLFNISNFIPASISDSAVKIMLLDEEMLIPAMTASVSSDGQAWNIAAYNILLFSWIICAMIFAAYVLYKNIRFWISIKDDPLLTDNKTLVLFEKCKDRMKISTVPKIVITDKVKSPSLFGSFQPRLLIPENILEKLNDTELAYIFLHELGHLKRHDVGVSWLMTFLQIIHWFNPLVWFAFYRMRIDQESACDEYVLSRITQNKSAEYANAIFGFLDKFCRNRRLPALVGILENKSQIKRRIAMIVNYRKYSKKMTAAAIAMLIMTGFVFFTLTGFAKEKQRQIPTHEAQVALDDADKLIQEQEDYGGAIKVLQDFLATQPEVIPKVLYMMLGQCWYAEENLEEAYKVHKEGYEAYPDDLKFLNNYGVMAYQTERYLETGRLFEKLYDFSEKKDIKHLNWAAGAFYKGENLEEAKRIYKRMIDLPGEPEKEWLSNVMYICIELGNRDEAKVYKSLLEEAY
jgi:bla regulator protein BlaR1